MSETLWPYLVVALAGFLPNEIFRVAAVFLARGIDLRSEWLTWVRIVAVTLLAAVVSRLVYAPGAALAAIPVWVRVLGIAVGVAAFFGTRRSVVLGIVAGEAVFTGLAWWLGR